LGETEGSNPISSTGESHELRGLRRYARTVSR
jgi:hypothetical protein